MRPIITLEQMCSFIDTLYIRVVTLEQCENDPESLEESLLYSGTKQDFESHHLFNVYRKSRVFYIYATTEYYTSHQNVIVIVI